MPGPPGDRRHPRRAAQLAGIPRPRRMSIGRKGNNDRVTAASAMEKSRIHSLTRPNMVSVGSIVWLSSELMFFAALFARYFSIRAADPSLWREHTPHLDVWYALPFTLFLVFSSVTCQIGVFAAERGDVFALRRWFAWTFVLGLIFLLGQANEYRTLVGEGVKINGDGYGSGFYLTTG